MPADSKTMCSALNRGMWRDKLPNFSPEDPSIQAFGFEYCVV